MVIKNKLLKTLPVLLMALSQPVTSQTITSDFDEAVNIIKGLSDSKTVTWAIETLQNTTDESKQGQANNVLGMTYLNGIGVEIDTLKAIHYFEKSGEKGYLKAYHNLGSMYFTTDRKHQNFTKAFSYFKQGADKCSVTCLYDLGYMYYKGLGCAQDYEASVDCFTKATELGVSPACMYMLGLCYRNGYGVECDDAMAEKYLTDAANYNTVIAIEEQLRGESEVDGR